MAIADGLQYTLSIVFGLIVSFLLAKLFSIVFSSGDENLGLTGKNPNEHHLEVISSGKRRKSAENDKRSDAELSKVPLIDSDDDWEGVETTELEEAFCAATAFVAEIAVDRSAKKVSSSLQLKLYGLYKVATEGACGVPQPSAIKITARAKWTAWHKLGTMSQEEAMQKYLEIITELYPSWADDKGRCGDNNATSSKDTRPMGPDFSSFVHEEESGNDFSLDDFARDGSADNLLERITSDVSVEAKDGEGETPLQQAVDHDDVDINLKDNEGQTSLHVHEPDETDTLLVKKNAATGVQYDEEKEDDGSYPSDLSLSNWHSIQP